MAEVPQKFDMKDAVPLNSDAPAKFDMAGAVPLENDFTANTNGEGTYEMAGPGGKKVKVPYSMISTASQAGYKMSDADRVRYVKDAAADPNLKKGAVVGKNSAGQDIHGADTGPTGSAAGRFASSAWNTVKDAATGLAHAVVDKPTSVTDALVNATGPGALFLKRAVVDPGVEQGKQSVAEAKKGNVSQAVGHGLAAVTPGVGPWAAQVGEQVGGQVGAGNYAGAAGTVAGNAAIYAAPHAVVKGADLAGNAAHGAIESFADNSPRGLKTLAEDTLKKNKEAAAEHLEKAQAAVEATRGKEIGHELSEKQANEKEYADHQLELAKVKAKNQEVIEKHNKELTEAKVSNDKVKAKYEKEAKQVQEENSGAEHALELRRQGEARLQQETDAYYAKEDAVKAKAKDTENAAWKPWHDKMQGVTVDGSDIAAPLQKIIEVSPEVSRVLRQLTPDASDVAPDSLFAQDRAAVMKTQGFKGSYWDLPPDLRSQVDSITASNGFEPEPIDFNPQAGQAIPIEQIHRAQSIIMRNIASGRYEGPLLGEMKQLAKVLDQVKTRASMNAGALSDLSAAKKATTEYQQAFGKERHIPKTQDEIRKQQANPDQFKEENDQERLDAAKKHDPTLASDYEKVKKQREQLKKMKTEDQLRKSLKKVPAPPTVGDLREGYSLKPEPESPVYTRRDAQGKLYKLEGSNWVPTDETGIKHQLNVEPPEPTFTVKGSDGTMYRLRDGKWDIVPQPRPLALNNPTPESVQTDRPTREPQPDRPEDQKADLEKFKSGNVDKFSKRLKEMAVRRALYTSVTGLTGSIIAVFLGHPFLAAAADIGSGLAVMGGMHAIAALIERPDVRAWASKVTEKDVQTWEGLPPDQKALFAQDMKALGKAAKEKGVKLSPALSAFIAGTASQSNIKALKKEAGERKPTIEDSEVVKADSERGIKSVTLPTVKDLMKQAGDLQTQFQQSGLSPQ